MNINNSLFLEIIWPLFGQSGVRFAIMHITS